jgi:hypothetical protein
MLNDEVVNEIRAIRDAHAEKFGYDLRAIFEDLKKSEAARITGGHPFVSSPQPAPVSSFRRFHLAHH